jgi:hypothetical protein
LAALRRLLKLRSKLLPPLLLLLLLPLLLSRLLLLPLLLLLLLAKPLRLPLRLLRLQNKFSNRGLAPKETEATLSPFILYVPYDGASVATSFPACF